MHTLTKSREIAAKSEKMQKHVMSAFWQSVEDNRFSIIPMLVVFVACAGGLAAGFGAYTDVLKLSMIAFPTILSLAFVLAVAPMRLVLYASSIAVILDVIVLLF